MTPSKHIVTIERLTKRGEGVVCIDETDLLVPFTLPGEVVEIEERFKTRKIKWGKVLDIKEKSPDRIQATCPHFGTCGGCLLQHFSDKLYKNYKKGLVTNALEAQGLDTSLVQDPIIVGKGQRRRIDFMARKWDGEVKLGFHEAESKKPFNIQTCPLIHPDIPPLFEPLRQFITPVLEQERLIHFFITRAQNGLDILLAGFKNPLSNDQEASLIKLAQEHGIIRMAYKVKKKEKILHFVKTPTVRYGKHDVEVTAFGFLQATKVSDQIFADFLEKHLAADKPKDIPIQFRNVDLETKAELPECTLVHEDNDDLQFSKTHISKEDGYIIDLFCGRGTLSLALTKMGHKVKGIECDGHALKALQKIEEPLLTIEERNLFESPLLPEELGTTVVINPPRAGAETQTHEIVKSKVDKLIYISCNADSFSRDCKHLLEHGFKIKDIIPVDQFMWTPHIEIMAYLYRSSFK